MECADVVCRFPQDVICVSNMRGEESRREGKTDIPYHAIVSHNGSKDARLDSSEIKVVKSRGERKEKRRKEKRKERV
jgi:hypothetical protein